MHGEFQIDQTAWQQLGVQRPLRRLVQRQLGPHHSRVGDDVARGAVSTKHRIDHRGHIGARGCRTENGARSGQRHMLPGPGVGALIAREAIQRDSQRSLIARGAQPRIDFVERAGRGRHRQRRRQALRLAVIVMDRTQRFRPVRFGGVVAGEEVDQIEI